MNLLHRIAVAAGFGLALLVPGVAHAHVPTVVPGAPCTAIGATGQHDGQTYGCEKHAGDVCGFWRWQYDGSVPKLGRTAWPHPTCPCASATPSHTPTATPTPSHTPTPTASPSGTAVIVTTPSPSTAPSKAGSATPVADTGQLPVTGSPVIWIVVVGILLTVAGLALRAVRARRNAV